MKAIRRDFQRTYDALGGSRTQRVLGVMRTPGFHAVAVYRFGHWLQTQPGPVRWLLKIPFLLLYRRMRARWGIEINPEAQIGEGFLVYHYGGIFVGAEVVMGPDCSVSHNVTLGRAGRGEKRGAPTLGEGVYIAPGANISGRITIGSRSRIGANVVLERSVPEDSLVQARPPMSAQFGKLYGKEPPGDVSPEAPPVG